ncbi:MAG: DNA polymerase III subunit delta', partial [Halothece sp. Uz-M2-17]|nr:DNA polymerase III subunit delta' [Halothece sp. Uz-M2-17]
VELALTLAKVITQNLDFNTQIWFINYLQQWYWKNALQDESPLQIQSKLKQLEASRKQLLNYVQPRLVWEVTFLKLI